MARTSIIMRESVKNFFDGNNRMGQVISILFAVTPDQVLYGYGPLGVGVVALSFVLNKMFKILMNDRDRAIQQRDALLEDFLTKVLPALTENTKVLGDRKELDKELVLLVRDSSNALKENTAVLSEIQFLLRSGRGNTQTGGN